MRAALITGATSGFGPTIAKHLSSKSFHIVLHGRDQGKLNILYDSLKTKNKSVCCCDALDLPNSAQKVYSHINDQKIVPSVVIHHVGGTTANRSALSNVKEWQECLNLNVFFGAEINRLIVPDLIIKKIQARIIHISSISAITLRGSSTYACSKALLNAYITSLSRELATSDIIVSGIMPGAFNTPTSNWSNYLKNNMALVNDFLSHHHATKRLGVPSEILSSIDFLIDPSNTFSQGCILNIDGGTM